MATYYSQIINHIRRLEDRETELKEMLERKLADLEIRRKWIKKLELEVENINNEIKEVECELSEVRFTTQEK